ncbi:hypothetical protein AAFF_G00147320 [Aldrovandia affinis]|uniref:Uncharacterized protein n=1 Tax=Aldrovandia affinis TaxID=143900 RepID=A0AAD7RPT2_9TELE|nr:hypothetical protein AAFF_G00147320 [Aldrovandia affinis]
MESTEEDGQSALTEGIVAKMFKWARKAEQPLRVYATGLLAGAMENQNILSQKRRALSWRRSLPAGGPLLLLSLDEEGPVDGRFEDPPLGAGLGHDKDQSGPSFHPCPSHRASDLAGVLEEEEEEEEEGLSGAGGRRTGAGPNRSSASLRLRRSFSELSNSSWSEMSSWFIGSKYHLYPVTPALEQRIILQYLTPLGEYQELLAVFMQLGVRKLLMHYLDLKQINDVQLTFKALKVPDSLD